MTVGENIEFAMQIGEASELGRNTEVACVAETCK